MTTTTAELAAVDHALAQLLDTPPTAVLVVIDCDTCGWHGEPISLAEAEAQNYAGVHDDFHHRGKPTAALRLYSPTTSATPLAR